MMDAVPKDLRSRLEFKLEELYKFLDDSATKQRSDITKALTANIKDQLGYLNCSVLVKEYYEFTEKEKDEFCEHLVDRALGTLPKPKIKKAKKKKGKKEKNEIARVLYSGLYCPTCFLCEGPKCKH